MKLEDYLPDPPPVGVLIRELVLPPGLSITCCAKILRMGRPALSSMLNGKAQLSIELAFRIECYFLHSASELLDYQSDRNLFLYKENNELAAEQFKRSFFMRNSREEVSEEQAKIDAEIEEMANRAYDRATQAFGEVNKNE